MKEHYWILFVEPNKCWDKVFSGEFYHISLLKNDGYNWMLIDPRPDQLHIEILPHEPDEDINKVFEYFNQSFKAVKVFIPPHSRTKFNVKKFFFPKFFNLIRTIKYIAGIKISGFFPAKSFNCVRAIKYILGIKVSGIFPDNFYYTLINMHQGKNDCDEIIVDSFIEHKRS